MAGQSLLAVVDALDGDLLKVTCLAVKVLGACLLADDELLVLQEAVEASVASAVCVGNLEVSHEVRCCSAKQRAVAAMAYAAPRDTSFDR